MSAFQSNKLHFIPFLFIFLTNCSILYIYLIKKEGFALSNFIEKCNIQIYKFIAFIIFLVGVFTVNSVCDLIFHQPEEAEELKRFSKYEINK